MKTLRQWAGLTAPTGFDPARSALVLIDFQREYFDGKLPIPDGPSALAAAQQLLAAAETLEMPVIHVHHVAANPAAPLFANGQPGAEPVAELLPAAHHTVVVKRMPSAFAGTGLAALLRERNRQTLILCGLMTHNCVDTTAREALHQGFAPVVVADACATRDLPGAAGGAPVPARQLHEAVLAGLADRIAEVMDTAQVLAALPEAVAA